MQLHDLDLPDDTHPASASRGWVVEGHVVGPCQGSSCRKRDRSFGETGSGGIVPEETSGETLWRGVHFGMRLVHETLL